MSEQQQEAGLPPAATSSSSSGGGGHAGMAGLFGGGAVPSQLVDATAQLQTALEYKEKGNGFVKQGDFKKASFNYKHALMYVQDYAMKTRKAATAASSAPQQQQQDGGGGGDFGNMADSFKRRTHISGEQQSAIDELWIATQNNLAFAHTKLGRHVDCINCAAKVLQHDAKNTKALYRRACGRVGIGELDKAKEDCLLILELKPDDAGTLAKLDEIKAMEAAADARQAAAYRKMFA